MLTLKLIEMYNSLLVGDSQMQLICTTHESNLLSTAPVRQDEIWFVEKDKKGEVICLHYASISQELIYRKVI